MIKHFLRHIQSGGLWSFCFWKAHVVSFPFTHFSSSQTHYDRSNVFHHFMTETKREKESSMCTRMLFVMNYSCRVETRQPSFLRCFSWKPTLWRWFDGRYSVGSLSPACSKPKVWLEPEGFTYKTLSYYYYFFEKKNFELCKACNCNDILTEDSLLCQSL